MFKYKLLKVGLAVISLVSFLISPLSDYIKAKTIGRYDLRWHQAVDKDNRIQTITVRNAGKEPKENLVLELDFGAHSSRVLSDFAVSWTSQGPSETFLNLVERTNASQPVGTLSAAEASRLSQLLDRHSASRRLNDLEDAFDELLKTRLEAANSAREFQPNNQQPRTWHANWKQKCSVAKPSSDCLTIHSVFTDWEKAKTSFLNAAIQSWREHTGVGLVSQSEQSLDNKLIMTLSLGANEHRVFHFYYSHYPATVSAAFRSTRGQETYQLNSADEAFSSFATVLFALHPICYVLLVVLIALLVRYGPLLLPLNVIPTYAVFNFALESKDEDYWKHALERHRFFVLRQFRTLKKKEKSGNPMTEQEILDYIRDWLTVRDHFGSPKLGSNKSLDRLIHDELWRLLRES